MLPSLHASPSSSLSGEDIVQILGMNILMSDFTSALMSTTFAGRYNNITAAGEGTLGDGGTDTICTFCHYLEFTSRRATWIL
jgi:hypothetical protein